MAKKKVVLPMDTGVQGEQSLEEQLYKPGKYEITDDDEFVIEFSIYKADGRWVITKDSQKGAEKHWVRFKMWSYAEESEFRKLASNYDEMRRIHSIDYDKLNQIKLRRLLMAWSFQEQNERLKLHQVGGVLTDECMKNVFKLHPNILRYIIDRMNGVLERNE